MRDSRSSSSYLKVLYIDKGEFCSSESMTTRIFLHFALDHLATVAVAVGAAASKQVTNITSMTLQKSYEQ